MANARGGRGSDLGGSPAGFASFTVKNERQALSVGLAFSCSGHAPPQE